MTKTDGLDFVAMLKTAPLVRIDCPGDGSYPRYALRLGEQNGRTMIAAFSQSGTVRLDVVNGREKLTLLRNQGLVSLFLQGLNGHIDGEFIDIDLLDREGQLTVAEAMLTKGHWFLAKHIHVMDSQVAQKIGRDSTMPVIVRAACYPYMTDDEDRRAIEEQVSRRTWKERLGNQAFGATIVAMTCLRDGRELPDPEAVQHIVAAQLNYEVFHRCLMSGREWMKWAAALGSWEPK